MPNYHYFFSYFQYFRYLTTEMKLYLFLYLFPINKEIRWRWCEGGVRQQRNDGGGCATMRKRPKSVESPGTYVTK